MPKSLAESLSAAVGVSTWKRQLIARLRPVRVCESITMRPARAHRFAVLIGSMMAVAVLLVACTGGTPWGATPQRIDVPVPDLRQAGEAFDGASGSTAGAQRVGDRVRAALAAQPALAGLSLQVEGLEGGLVVLSGQVPSASERALAVHTARQVTGVRDVVDRLVSR